MVYQGREVIKSAMLDFIPYGRLTPEQSAWMMCWKSDDVTRSVILSVLRDDRNGQTIVLTVRDLAIFIPR